MRAPKDNAEDAWIADNLCRTIELAELGLAVRRRCSSRMIRRAMP